ncbi:ribosomal lysine N-methyltransferase [Achaetomium macrosporum]|uniref:Ribosomal lysine N-methyltransferase n=1 Tax=Achaetomium macrosporum TaxID=79813 RepID=A0AAN7HGI3_9PEZI|nr:ribosomal lysine N-methyltransferase [Achaetomium macrosporum]
MVGDKGSSPGFAQATRDFLNWFQALSGATLHNEIAIEDLRGQGRGRGIIARTDIEPGTVLFTIPRGAIICAATSTLKYKIPAVFNLENGDDNSEDEGDGSSSSQQDSWTLLILIMIYEHLQGDASRWKPYLDILPSSFDTPMFWSSTELSELQASALVGKIGRTEADQMIQTKILPIIRAHEDVFFGPHSQQLDDAQLLELAHRFGSTIMAYAFDLEKDDDEKDAEGQEEDDEWVEDKEGKTMLGMVPMADLLNADAEFNAHINHAEEALTATALRKIKAGEEILNYYGPLPNGELLRRYGYVTPKHSRYDVVELPWQLVENELRERVGSTMSPSDWERVKQLAQSDEEFEEGFVLERSSEDPDSTGQLHSDAAFSGLPDELGEQFKTFLKAVKKVNGNAELAVQALSDRDARKELYLQTVLATLHARERQYATSLEEDERLMNAAEVTERQRMAVWVRRGEKQLMREAQSWVRRELDELQNKASQRRQVGDDAPAAKRRRM